MVRGDLSPRCPVSRRHSNPTGLLKPAQGCRARLPWDTNQVRRPNPNGVVTRLKVTTPSWLETNYAIPQGSRVRQPWAFIHNPVGVDRGDKSPREQSGDKSAHSKLVARPFDRSPRESCDRVSGRWKGGAPPHISGGNSCATHAGAVRFRTSGGILAGSSRSLKNKPLSLTRWMLIAVKTVTADGGLCRSRVRSHCPSPGSGLLQAIRL